MKLNDNDNAWPCGLVAKSFFTDRYALYNSSNADPTKKVTIDETGIAWDSDKTYKFIENSNYHDKYWQVVTDGKLKLFDLVIEHFIVWMRTAGLPNFRKLWGKINTVLTPGTYTLAINNKYDVSSFDGKKSFVLSTTNALGGKNYFLAICYIVVGSLCIVFAVIFLVAYLKKKSSNHTE